MKFSKNAVTRTAEILYNDHYVAIPYDCSAIQANDKGIVPAGTIVPKNDATAVGVLLHDVKVADNPNGTIVIHGFINKAKLPAEPDSDAVTALKAITFLPFETASDETEGDETEGDETEVVPDNEEE